MKRHALLLIVCAFAASSCGKKKLSGDEFGKLTEEFVYSTLALSPVSATASGYHAHQGKALDELLDDYSAAGLAAQKKHWADWKQRLAGVDQTALDAQAKADLELMDTTLRQGELELDVLQAYKHNPTVYVELIGNALFTPYSVSYAPEEARWKQITARLKAVPALLDAAQKNLVDSNPVWTRVAGEEMEGNLALVEQLFPAKIPAGLKGAYDEAAKPAAAAMRAYVEKLKNLKDTGAEGWRLGGEQYARKFALQVDAGVTPDQLLADAEAELTAVRKEMFIGSIDLHVKYYPTHRDPVDVNLIVGETLKKIAEKHAKPADYFAAAEKSLAETREFLKTHEKQLVGLPGRDNLKLIETPEFMRGVYGVGGFSPAPALEPQLGAFYWLTPMGKDWPAERVESKLREYNDFGLRLLTIHEAIPGHYVQFEYAGAVEPKARRVLRSVFGSGPYVEGWAVYSTEAMLDAGYLNKDPELRLTFQKQLLRAIANTILDIKMHTKGMTDAEAMKLMTERTFQEKQEAEAKLQRAKLSSCQLPTYFAGYRAWKALRAALKEQQGEKFDAGLFHRKALEAGALPMETLSRVLGLEKKQD